MYEKVDKYFLHRGGLTMFVGIIIRYKGLPNFDEIIAPLKEPMLML
jgi:hypothetical protein